MPFIGQEPLVGGYHVLDNITTSSTNTYNLALGGVAFSPESANHLLVSLNGVIQKPGGAFSVGGSQITFIPSSGTLSNSDSIDFIIALGDALNIGTPSDNTITTAKKDSALNFDGTAYRVEISGSVSFSLKDKEKEAALNNEKRWKDRRITEMMQEIRRLKGK